MKNLKIFLTIVLGIFVLGGCTPIQKTISIPEAKEKMQKFLDLQGNNGKVIDVVEENGIYKVTGDFNGEKADAYLSKDGKTLFPSKVNIDEMMKQKEDAKGKAEEGQKEQLKSLEKKAVPEVELFVMSHCPFGTQIEKGIIPVVKTLGDKIKFEIKFVDYAMHEKKEIDEQLQQYCIQREAPKKFIPYLECFLEEGDSEKCLAESGVDIASCVSETDDKFEITKNYENKEAWQGGQFPPFNIHKEENDKYGVQGSPTLVINGKQVDSGRSPKSLMETICAAFETQPEECKTEMDSATPSAGFGFKQASAGTPEASCNE